MALRYLNICVLGLVLSLSLTACESATINKRPQLVAQPDKVSAMLADAADRAANSLETLAAIETTRGPDIAAPSIGNAPAELLRPVSLYWNGPAEQVSRTMANQAGYRFKTVGSRSATELIVLIDVERSTIIDVLRDIGLQLGTRADIKVDAQQRSVELHYAPNNRNQGQSTTMREKRQTGKSGGGGIDFENLDLGNIFGG